MPDSSEDYGDDCNRKVCHLCHCYKKLVRQSTTPDFQSLSHIGLLLQEIWSFDITATYFQKKVCPSTVLLWAKRSHNLRFGNCYKFCCSSVVNAIGYSEEFLPIGSNCLASDHCYKKFVHRRSPTHYWGVSDKPSSGSRPK